MGKNEHLDFEGKLMLCSEWVNVSGVDSGSHLLLCTCFLFSLFVIYVLAQYNFKWLYELYQPAASKQQFLKIDINIWNHFLNKHIITSRVKIQLNNFFLNNASHAMMKCWWKSFGKSMRPYNYFCMMHHHGYLNNPFVIKF